MEGGKAELAASAWEEKLNFIKAYIMHENSQSRM